MHAIKVGFYYVFDDESSHESQRLAQKDSGI